MAEFRERPYSQFNFLVNIQDGPAEDSPQAGFQEVSGIGLEVTVAEYRPGNAKTNAPMKVTGLHKVPDITLKRGVVGSLELYDWIKQIRDGSQSALRSVTIKLQTEDRASVAQTWRLTNARPIKYTGPSLSGKGTDVAVEELVLSCERIDIE